MTHKAEDENEDGEISDIRKTEDQIIRRFANGETLAKISEDMKIRIQIVNQCIKKREKAALKNKVHL